MGSLNLPLVSICIPTYNGELYIKEAMGSAISQTYTNIEIVVSDDASEDNTLAIIETYKNKTKIPIFIHNQDPNGIGANWNYCVTKAHGQYIKFLFQDDLLEPNCIESMMALAIKNPQVGLLYCKRELIYDQMTPKIKDFMANYSNLHCHWDSFKVTEGIQSGKSYLKDRELLNSPKNKISEPTNVLLKTECFNNVGYFSEVLKQDLDVDYWYRVMRYYEVGFIDEFLVKFRLHQMQASNINKLNKLKETNLLYEQYYNNLLWYLHSKNKLKLLNLFHPIFKILVYFKRKFLLV